MEADDTRKRGTARDIVMTVHEPVKVSYTAKQGQYLAFIYYYGKIHGRSPSQADMQGYFHVSPPPPVHQMVLGLEKLGFIERTPGQGRSLKLLLNREQLPDLI
jgi:DNA-binding MarR family transcriptional regulator